MDQLGGSERRARTGNTVRIGSHTHSRGTTTMLNIEARFYAEWIAQTLLETARAEIATGAISGAADICKH